MPGTSSKGGIVDYLAEGSYQIHRFSTDDAELTKATEYLIGDFDQEITAMDEVKDQLYTWVRARIFVYGDISTQPVFFDWFVVEMDHDDANPDLDDEETFRNLQKNKKIYARGTIFNIWYGQVKPIAIDLYRVRLKADHELRLYLYPRLTTAADTVSIDGVIEYRWV